MSQVVPTVAAVPTGHTALVRAGTGLLATAIVLGLFTLSLVIGLPLTGSGDTALSRVAVAAYVVGMTVLTMVGAVLIGRRPTHPMGWWMVVTGLTAVSSRLIAGYAGTVGSGALPAPEVLLWTTNWIWVLPQVAALEVLLRFPTGQLANRKWRLVEWPLLAWGACTTMVTALLPGPLGQENLSDLVNPYGVDALSAGLTAALSPLFTAIPILSIACAAALILRWRGSDAETRQQLRWVAAAAAALAVTAPFAILGGVPELALGLAFLLLPAAISMAVLRSRLWELGVVVRRTAVYGVSVGVLAAAYVAAIALVNSRATPLVAGVAMALLAVPVRDLADRVLERSLFGHRGDPGLVAAALANRLQQSTEPVVQDVVDQLRESLRLPYIAITDAEGSVLAAAGQPQESGSAGAVTRIPLSVRGTPVGWLLADERAPGEGLGPRDRALLEQVGQPAGLAVHSLKLDADLRASHARMLAIRDQERARLQRDLHDGLGPTLGGITLRAEATRNLLLTEAPASQLDDVLAQIGDAAEAAIVEIRRLIEDLRPTSLERFGLRRALLDAANDAAGHVEVDVSIHEPLPRIDAQVEVSAYRIAVEALRNVRRHAQARTCRLLLDVEGDDLRLEITDDGIGIGGTEPGVGMRSMADRAEAAGGSLRIITNDAGGTCVRARIPVGQR